MHCFYTAAFNIQTWSGNAQR